MRTPGLGESRFSSTSGVCPIARTMSEYLPPHGRFSSEGPSVTSKRIAVEHGPSDIGREPAIHDEARTRRSRAANGAARARTRTRSVCTATTMVRSAPLSKVAASTELMPPGVVAR